MELQAVLCNGYRCVTVNENLPTSQAVQTAWAGSMVCGFLSKRAVARDVMLFMSKQTDEVLRKANTSGGVAAHSSETLQLPQLCCGPSCGL